MTPFQKKIRRLTRKKFLPPQLFSAPERIPPDKLTSLVTRLKSGDTEVINEIVMGHLRLGLHIASRYGSLYPDKIDDIVGVMTLALVKYVRKARHALRDNNITPYLTTNIHEKILDFVENDHCVNMPSRTVRHYVYTGNSKLDTVPVPIAIHKDYYEEYESPNHQDIYKSPENSGSFVVLETTDENLIEINELLEKVTPDFIERRVIELRAQGYTYSEISPQVGYSVSSIHLIVNTVEKRFMRIYTA